MISNQHYIELFINGELAELKSQDSLNLRINSVLFKPTQAVTKQGEYSFSISLPSTPTNDKIFNYANNLSKTNKFLKYRAEVYADGTLVFEGTLANQKYSAKDKMYTCNLVTPKIDTLEEIFGEEKLTDVEWFVDFDGVSTINSVNADPSTKYWFPLVSYGAFGKIPYDGYLDAYTSKYQIDSLNTWYIDSFYPSLNVGEMMKKCFAHKGYNASGEFFTDPTLNSIYASTNLADGQQPIWNVGNSKFGDMHIGVSWSGSSDLTYSGYFQQDLKFPYFPIGGNYYDFNTETWYEPQWNFTEVFINPLFKNGDLTYHNSSTMFVPSDRYAIIPADGFYKVSLDATVNLTQQSSITATQYVCNWNDRVTAMSMSAVEEEIQIAPDLTITTPIEIQLVRNYDENLELIKGKYNINLSDGHPDHETECDKGRYTNYINIETCFPHEATGRLGAFNVTKYEGISDWMERISSDANIGYMNGDNEIMCYDPVVSPIFICGMTTMGSKNGRGCGAIIKNGYSWSHTYSERTDAMYIQQGYLKAYYDDNFGKHYDPSNHNFNFLNGSPNYENVQTSRSAHTKVSCIVYLRKNDKIELMAVRRGYWNGLSAPVSYDVTIDADLRITAASPKELYELKAENYGWNSPTEFPTQLNLMNFTNEETNISDWLKSIQDAFNLSFEFDNKNVMINPNKGIKKDIDYAVDIDDRVNSDEAESEYISYPSEMAVMYKIDTQEHGFYDSVPQEHINKKNWKNFGDSGFTIIKLDEESLETTSQKKQTQFSYTWYDIFKVKSTWNVQDIDISIPVISKEEYMIDGYYNPEASTHRGYNLAQRFWFRTNTPIGGENSGYYGLILLDDWDATPTGIAQTPVNIYVPINRNNRFNLSYKDTEKSILTEYFNIYPMLGSNYVTIETHLNPNEYMDIKGGALIHFDSDLYYTSEISGYDPSGRNTTKLKLIKKV